MPEHYTKNTLEATVWCNRCGKDTQHRIDGGRRGPCLECMRKRELQNEYERIKRGLEQEQKAERESKTPKLF
jgi:hypothetical protein